MVVAVVYVVAAAVVGGESQFLADPTHAVGRGEQSRVDHLHVEAEAQ